MLRYKTETRPGLVALYDIRPGNGAGPFLQPRSPHGALKLSDDAVKGLIWHSFATYCLFAWCLTAFSAQIGYIMPWRYEVYHVGWGDNTNISCN